ncbi:DeoR/GlpR family DNA-binding transcription regulator [Kamptonema cortianum]|nr:DeoR/GlpR family DNA-binding transcription regulator [Oscillatoria laete-virens]MDK3156422.1 DeoR/GlpR family DNA-binding transcription regulator [Kamptonema cortianum]MDL5046281.1 DeoR/GlpR family DNA-binding transcription regulator [Oscillatoria amoena NRMC-F 0135]
MFAQERFQKITSLLEQKGRLSVQTLEKALGVSPATLRRDLSELEVSGKLIRIHGGVMHPAYFNGEPSYEQKTRENLGDKQAIADVVADLIPSNASVLIDSGTTCMEIGRRLLRRKDLTIITNSIPLLNAAHSTQAQVICIGGQLRVVNQALVGEIATQWMEGLSADFAVLSSSGLSLDRGATTTELTEAQMKKLFLKRADKVILAADASKWGQNRPVTFAQFEDFDYWVTAGAIPEEHLRMVKRTGVRVILAGRGKAGAAQSTHKEAHA